MKGYVQVYTGDGKGKTTAALGLAIRAAGAGLKVYFAQFVKGMKYSELTALEKFSESITVKQFGRDCFIYKKPQEEDIQAALNGLKEAREAMCSGKYQVVVLDEANIAIYYRLFSVEDLLDFIRARPPPNPKAVLKTLLHSYPKVSCIVLNTDCAHPRYSLSYLSPFFWDYFYQILV